jgi:GT2 family glycosyltransferase
MLDLSIVIVNYNVKEFLTQCIDSIYKSKTSYSFEVIVVDNNSADSGEKSIREQFPSVHWINNPENIGFGKANNIGFETAKGEYTLILNPDTVLQSDAIEKCLNFLGDHPEVGGLGIQGIDGSGRFLPESKRALPTPLVALWKITGLSSLFPKSRLFARYHLGHLDKNENHEVDILVGCFMMVPTKLLRQVQGFDTRYFMYGEDIDLSYELQKTGKKNIYFSESRIIHYKGESTKRGSLNYVRMFYKAMVLFAQKQFSGSAAWAYKLLIYFGIYLRASLAVVARIARSAFAPALDGALLFTVLNHIKVYWEFNHRFINGGSYPDLYTFQIQGSYVFLWIFGLWVGGAYFKGTQPKHLIRSMFFTTLLIGFTYGLLPEELRFSRALLMLGALIGTAVLLSYRALISLLTGQRLFQEQQQQPRIIFYGKDSNFESLQTILKESNVYPAFTWKQNPLEENDIETLGALIQLHRINELIIDNDSISYDKFIELTVQLGSHTSIKSLLPHQGFIIGSDSSLSQGSTYKKQYFISDPNYLRQRRIYEIVLTFFILNVPVSLLTALIFGRLNGWKAWIQNAGNILIGKRSLIGYTSALGEKFSLPEIPEPIFDICRELPKELDFPQNAKAFIEDYAKEAQIHTDLLRLWQLSKY